MKKIMAGEGLTKGLLERLNDNAWGVTYGLLVVVSERKKWDLSMGVAALHDKSNRTIVSIPARGIRGGNVAKFLADFEKTMNATYFGIQIDLTK